MTERPGTSSATMLTVVTLVLAVLALATPFVASEYTAADVGWLLALAAAIEMLHALRRSDVRARRDAASGALISMAIALFLINAPFVAGQALRWLIAGWFGIDAILHATRIPRAPDRRGRRLEALATLGNAGAALLLMLAPPWMLAWIVAVAGALRIFGIAWNIRTAAVYLTTEADTTVVAQLGFADEPEAVAMASEVEAAEQTRAPIDRSWTIAFIVTLFAIHVGRMQVDFTFLGLVSPAVAVFGDMVIAVIVSLLIINPLYLLWRGPTRLFERALWRWRLRRTADGRWPLMARAADGWLRWRMRLAIRARSARFSVPTALAQGLQTGLPLAAILAATVPVWGMSWYFDTENWAAGIWNSYAASRTDSWREAMVRAVLAQEGGTGGPATFAVAPEGVDGDFSFIVIGDTGEGDASQHVLRDQLLTIANEPGVRFVVVSSDVVYPTGAMKDYEAKFWLPFKGVSKPVYAIPGNHDWYDALDAFAVTFLRADAARASLHARVETDLKVSSTTDARIELLIDQAAKLREHYRVPTGFQRAPFFEIQTGRFALVAIDTGVLRTIDPAQEAWLEAALTRASGKFTMAIVGHPFFAGGHDVTTGDAGFERVKAILLRHGVSIMMAGDTHDLEYYGGSDATPGVHYFVNGGGGAYLSFGTALAWPAQAPTRDWAYYPDHRAVTDKIETATPWWKRPAWWWTKHFDAWPFSSEWLSALFDYNVAPFFQSFIEVKVEPSANRVRLIPYGVYGRLTWRDIAASERVRGGAADTGFVEWTVPMASGAGR